MSIKAYPNHIETDSVRFKSIPSHWQLVPCRAIVEEIAEKNSDGKNQNYLSLMANVGVIKYEDKGDVGNKKPDDLAKCKVVRVGNLVINSMNYGIGSYGLSAFNGVCSPVYIVLNAIEGVLNERFALRIFEEKQFQSFAQSFGNGILAHRAAIGWDDLKKIEVPLPPLSEQTQIARFLDHETAKIDALIAEQKRLIKLLKEKRQAVISHAVTKGLDPSVPMKDSGVEWLGAVPEHWKVGALGYYSRIETGSTPDRGNPKFWEGEIPWIKTGEVNYQTIFDSEEKVTRYAVENTSVRLAPPGTLLMAMYGQGVTRGRVAILGIHSTFNQACAAINVNKLLKVEFLELYFKFAYSFIRDGGNETSQMNLNASQVAKFPIVIPTLVEQSKLIKKIDEEISALALLETESKKLSETLKERRSALISAAVTGKIDVRNWQPPADESAFPVDVRQAGLEATA